MSAHPYLDVVPADVAHQKFEEALRLAPAGTEGVPLEDALGRVLANDVAATIDVPGFDRANLDGFAVRAEDTFGADEESPVRLRIEGEPLSPGTEPTKHLAPGTARRIATGGIVPGGADAVVMVENATWTDDEVRVQRAVTPGLGVSFAGSDLSRGEVAVERGTTLTARETGTLAALGITEVEVYARPRIGVLSTGDEITPPGQPLDLGHVYDSNARIVADSLRELGAEPVALGIAVDDEAELRAALDRAKGLDGLILSGGTSKGEGDLTAKLVREFANVICHGVALKPGKPLCLAERDGKPVVVLPGFPTSAVFTFHEFVAPVIRRLTGAVRTDRATEITATLPHRVRSEAGRTEFLLVHLVRSADDGELIAYPMGKGSGSVTTFSKADGVIQIGRHEEFLDAGESVDVRLLGRDVEPADLVVIGSHCVGLERVLAAVRARGFTTKTLVVGSAAGFKAAARGECDIAGVHLAGNDGVYNTPFLEGDVELVPGYGRTQGVIFRGEVEPDLRTAPMVNRNRGSGTRVVIDELIGDARPPGYLYEVRSHHAACAAVEQERADWGVAIESVSRDRGLSFRAVRAEQYDFVVPKARRERPAVRAFLEALRSEEVKTSLKDLSFEVDAR